MIYNKRHIRIIPQVLFALFVFMVSNGNALANEEYIERFFKSCIGTLPHFANLDETLVGSKFRKSAKNVWKLEGVPNNPFISLNEKSERLICSLAIMGDHSKDLSSALVAAIKNKSTWRIERKTYQGRVLYLVQTERGLTMLEVAPPRGAFTFILAHSLNKRR